MKNLYSKISILAIVAALFMGTTENAEAAKRRVVIEDHTGAWCGWCTRGTQSLRDMVEEFGDDVIAVQIHNTSAGRPDAMAIPELQGPLSQAIGLTGFPSGSVNRIRWNLGEQGIAIAVSDGYWKPLAQEVFNQPSLKTTWADVDVRWNVDENGKLQAEVSVTADADVNGKFGFNLFVLEDGVTGTGNGYNQQNYLSGRSGFEGHYYYTQPAVITGYVHDNVLRYMLGGIMGADAPFPTETIKSGDTFKYGFVQDISGRVMNYENVRVVAVVHSLNSGDISIVNAKMSDEEDATVKIAELNSVLTDNNAYNSQGANETITESITLENPNDFEITVELEVSSNSVLSEGWSAEFENSSVTIPANSEISVNLTINSSDYAGLNMINVSAKTSGEGVSGVTNNISMFSYATHTKIAQFYLRDNVRSGLILNSIYNENTRANIKKEASVIPLSTELFSNYDFSTVDLAIMPSDGSSIQNMLSSTSGVPLINLAQNLLNNGKSVLMSSNIDLWYCFNTQTNQSFKGTTQAVNFFNEIGIKSSNYNQNLPYAIADFNQNGQLVLPFHELYVEGYSGDDITNGMSIKLNEYEQGVWDQYYSGYVDLIKIEKANQVEPILKIVHKNATGKPDNEKAMGVKINYKDARMIYLGFSLELIRDDAKRMELISKSIDWLLGEVAPAPNMVLSTDELDFGKVGEKTDMELTISNTGNAELIVDEVSISNNNDGVFSVADLTDGKVAAGADLKVVVSYTPKDKASSIATLTVKSNAGNQTVSLKGESSSGSVDDYLANTGLFIMNVGPNPVVNQSQFTYELNSTTPEQLELNLVDMKGNVVANLFSGVQTPGTYNFDLSSTNYANGKYFIIANLMGHNAKLPVVITK